MNISNQLIQCFTQQLQRGGFTNLLKIESFYQQIIVPILKQSPNLVFIFKESLHKLLNVLQQRVEKIPKIEENIPQIILIIKEIRRAIGGAVTKKANTKELSNVDKNFVKFLRDEEVKQANPNNSSFYDLQLQDEKKIKLRMPVLISTKNFKPEWQIVFTAIRESFKAKKDPNLCKRTKQSFQQIKRSNISIPLCLGCSEYFYQKVNIRDLQFSKTDVIVIPKIKDIPYHKELLKNSICALLNSYGGVILFDCIEEYMQVLPVGSYITQLQKEQFQQQITEVFKYFKPKVSFGTHIDLTFVPIVVNPYQNSKELNNLNFIKGRYVTRLRVWNNQRYRLILYQELNSQLAAYLRIQGQTVRFLGRQLEKQIKRVFDRFYCPDNLDKDIFQLPQHCFQSHQCKQPKLGIQLETSKRDEGIQFTDYDLQGKYKYVSFMFLRQEDPFKIQKMFKKEQKNPFQMIPHSPKTSDNFYMIFHDSAHREMKQIFNSNTILRSNIGRKQEPPVFLFVQNGLQLETSLEQKTFNHLVKYIRSKNSTQSLKYIEGPKTYFITTGFRVSLFYIFGKLKQMNVHNIKLVKIDVITYESDERFKIIEAPSAY